MLCILHGYLLEGSGSNLWTRAIARSLCREGETIHLVCQENHPDHYDFIAQAFRYHPDGSVEMIMAEREVPYPGRCIMHKPQLGEILPVYVWDKYEEFSTVVPMAELPDEVINDYLERNINAVKQIVQTHGITAIHANHAVLMSVVAQQVSEAASIPFSVMPHGSAIEYAVKKDERFHRYADEAFTAASRIFTIGPEIQGRVRRVFPSVSDLDGKMAGLNLGVDTSLFEPISRHQRRENIVNLEQSISGLSRGKSPELSRAMRTKLSGDMSQEALQTAVDEAAHYANKSPDVDTESKLNQVDWENDRVLLFVGRIIASKGLQSILAALPLILDQQPDTRLVVVGHGPLREPLEAFLWALEHGERSLAENIVRWGSVLEGFTERPLEEVQHYWVGLEDRGEKDSYFDKAQKHIRPDRVIFTGYLTHRELRYLFPCCDAAIFPSVVAEAGPLVFLEAMASGCFPMGTYFAGMAASIDSVAPALSARDADLMRLSADSAQTVADIVSKTPQVLELGDQYQDVLRRVAVDRYDWSSVARKFANELQSLSW